MTFYFTMWKILIVKSNKKKSLFIFLLRLCFVNKQQQRIQQLEINKIDRDLLLQTL